jgi:hypothetical protein
VRGGETHAAAVADGGGQQARMVATQANLALAASVACVSARETMNAVPRSAGSGCRRRRDGGGRRSRGSLRGFGRRRRLYASLSLVEKLSKNLGHGRKEKIATEKEGSPRCEVGNDVAPSPCFSCRQIFRPRQFAPGAFFTGCHCSRLRGPLTLRLD